MEVSIDRITKDLTFITNINATPNNGITRFSYSKEDFKVREYLVEKMRDIGLEISIDGVGNIRGKLCNEHNVNNPSVMIGSHMDTVMNGGSFDGLIGVLVALEVIRVIAKNQIKVGKPIELVIFAEEEGSNFDITLLGSKAMTGYYNSEDLKRIKNTEGISAYDVMERFNLDVDNIENHKLKNGDIHSMIELHVEQGGILDNLNIPIGIVKSIAGMKTLEIIVEGISNHAGSTPMNLRNDPLVATSELIQSINLIANEKAFTTTVATVGKLIVEPNKSNVISKKVEFFVDVRDVRKDGIDKVHSLIMEESQKVSIKYGVNIKISEIGESEVVHLSSRVIDMIEKAAINKNILYKKMNSGAVHDAVMLADITDVGMIFIPSIGGFSHCKEEKTNIEDIKIGADLLLETVLSIVNN